jgi:anti-sigma factor RsiW
MSCDLSRERLLQYLEGSLPGEEARQVEAHLESCLACQAEPLLSPAFAGFLQDKLPAEAPSPALRARLNQSLQEEAVEGAGSSWWQRWLGSPWMPRVAMATVLAFLLLVPVRTFLRAPALAQEAVSSHENHLPSIGGALPACCTDLGLHVGDVLGPPSAGALVPDLRPLGLELVVTSLCSGKIEVTRLCYRDAQGSLFSLYMTDQVAEEFQQLRPRETRGLPQAQYRVDGNEVTLWERGDLVHFWIGPRGSSHYDQALEILQRQD